MKRKYNFNPGPSTLPLPVLEQARDELLDYKGKGYSILEASHRSKEYSEIHEETIGLVRQLMGLSNDFTVLLLGGGATLQFSMVPLNLIPQGGHCNFILSGSWAHKAYKDAAKIGKVEVLYDGKSANYTTLPEANQVKSTQNAAYLHITSNETIQGVQWQQFPHENGAPLVSDMSSDIMSRSIPVEQFGLFYAGAQKNLGPAGVTLVVIRNDLLDRCRNDLPAYLSYKTHASKNSLYNTPPVFAVYLMNLVLKWVKNFGGLVAISDLAKKRAKLIYDVIDTSGGFYNCPVNRQVRSTMNVVFRLPNDKLEAMFLEAAGKLDLVGLKGHRSVGGIRASLYNAMPLEGAEVLAGFMRDFVAKFG